MDTQNAPDLWQSLARLFVALGGMIALIYGFLRMVKRFGWESVLSRWGARIPAAGAPAPRVGLFARRAPSPAPAQTDAPEPVAAMPSRPAETDVAAPAADGTAGAPDFGTLLRVARSAVERTETAPVSVPTANVEKNAPATLKTPEAKPDKNTRVAYVDPGEDDDQIPQTSLEAALRRRHQRD